MDLLEQVHSRAVEMMRDLSPLKSLRELSRPEKRRLQEDIIATFWYIKGAYKKTGEVLFTKTGSNRTRGIVLKLGVNLGLILGRNYLL